MKKLVLGSVALMALAANAMAADQTITAGGTTTYSPVAVTVDYTVDGTPANRLFVKNQFTFTLSAKVVATADEDTDGRYMSVGAVNTSGRNAFTGNSDGGSVSACGDALTAEAAKVADALTDHLADKFLLDAPSGCADNAATP
jgi:opacity protein-like surface antigen